MAAQSNARCLGSNIDYFTLSGCEHVPTDGLGHEEGAHHVDGHRRLPCLDSEIFGWSEQDHARIIDEDVDSSEPGNDLIDTNTHGLRFGDVARERRTVRPQCRRLLERPITVEVDNSDPGALGHKSARNCGADASGSTGYNGGFALE